MAPAGGIHAPPGTCSSLVNFSWLNGHLSEKKLFIRFTARAFRKLVLIYVSSNFPFGSEGRIWDLIVSVPDHCLYLYFECKLEQK